MESSMALADLKKALKEFKKNDTPKLSAKKADLMAYAKRVGIIKSPEEKVAAPVLASSAAEKVLPKELKAKPTTTLLKVKEPLPEVLKAKVEKPLKKTMPLPPSPPASAKKTSPFATFMADNKGKGYTMSQLAQLYKDSK